MSSSLSRNGSFIEPRVDYYVRLFCFVLFCFVLFLLEGFRLVFLAFFWVTLVFFSIIDWNRPPPVGHSVVGGLRALLDCGFSIGLAPFAASLDFLSLSLSLFLSFFLSFFLSLRLVFLYLFSVVCSCWSVRHAPGQLADQ